MKKILFSFTCLLVLASCGKRDQPSAAHKYATADEADLKGIVRTRFDSPNPTEAQLARRAKNNKTIRDMGLPVLEDLPVVEDEKTAPLRTAEEIAKRCLATTFCAVKGETKDQAFVDSLIKDYSAAPYFSPEERQFIKDENPPQQKIVGFAWRYECVHVFLWALAARDDLGPPNEICSVADDMKRIRTPGPAKFVADSRRRSAQEILDMADLYYRFHWAAINLRIKGQKSDLLDEEVIRERHRALNWLIGYMNQEWDDITTDT
jgi:hypothetical protein